MRRKTCQEKKNSKNPVIKIGFHEGWFGLNLLGRQNNRTIVGSCREHFQEKQSRIDSFIAIFAQTIIND